MQIEQQKPSIQSKRRTDVVNLLHEFLLRNDMMKTAQILKKQALIADKQNIEQYIETIKKSQNLRKQQKQHKIKTQLEKKYYKDVSQNDYDSALRILNDKMPEYFSEEELQKFAQNLIPSKENMEIMNKNDNLLENMFESYFIKNSLEDAKLPNSRKQLYESTRQIWFVKWSGTYLVAIDQDKKGLLFNKDLQLIQQKQELHEKMVSNIKWRNESEFATSSQNGQIKLWNHKFQLLHLFKYHKKLINSFTFCNYLDKQFLVSGGHDKYIMFNNITSINDHIQTKIKMKQLVVRDIKYYKKRNQLIFLHEKKKEVSVIKFFNPDSMKWMGQVKVNEQLLEMQISPNDDILHIITQTGEIVNYSLKTYEKIGVFIGTKSKNFVIRMQKGGYMNQFLATGSESGQVLIYNERKIEPIKKLQTSQKTVVNSVTWVDVSCIVCGCDNGKIELWVYEKQKRNQ